MKPDLARKQMEAETAPRNPAGAPNSTTGVSAPSADRLHRASKANPRVALYTDRRLDLLRTTLAGERIHRAAQIPVTVFPQPFLRELETTLERNVRWDVSISDGHLYVTIDSKSFDAELHPMPLFEDEARDGTWSRDEKF